MVKKIVGSVAAKSNAKALAAANKELEKVNTVIKNLIGKTLSPSQKLRLEAARAKRKKIKDKIKGLNSAKSPMSAARAARVKKDTKPETFESEKRKILGKAAMPGGHDKELIALAKKYNRTIKINGKVFAPPKQGPKKPTAYKRGGKVKKK